MRTATLVGLASIPVGFLWIYLAGPESGIAIVLAGALVGVIYSDGPEPAYRAGARAGLFASIPIVIVQPTTSILDFWATSMALEVKILLAALFGLLGVLFLWITGALFCIASAVLAALLVDTIRPHLANARRSQS
ncbi:hypothetical protein GCM10028857_04800 [Salinarchaeum chitinilyticum]